MRRFLVAGNWKMHGSHKMTTDLISGIAEQVLEKATDGQLGYDILVCPSSPYLSHAVSVSLASALSDNPDSIMVGAQDVSPFEKGAYTGEVSLPMLSDLGCEYVLLGHSERRHVFNESSESVAEKFAACAVSDTNVVPVLCVGESLPDREAGNTEKVVGGQIDAVLDIVGIAGFANAVIAYEPVWAIGTGVTASPEQAQEVHAFIRAKLAKLNAETANAIQIVYGGSVKPENAHDLFASPDIDGGLIGGAALKVDSFVGICEAARKLTV